MPYTCRFPIQEKLKNYLVEYGYPDEVYAFIEPSKGDEYYKKLPYHDLLVRVPLLALYDGIHFIIREDLSEEEIAQFTTFDKRFDYTKDNLYLANLKNNKFDFYKFTDGKWNPVSKIPPYLDLIRYQLDNPKYSSFILTIQEVILSNFSVFRNATFKFGKKLNIITGENGSGKSHLIKILHAMHNSDCLRYSNEKLPPPPNAEPWQVYYKPREFKLYNVFKNNAKELISKVALEKKEVATGTFKYYNCPFNRTFSISPNGESIFTNGELSMDGPKESFLISANNVFSFHLFLNKIKETYDIISNELNILHRITIKSQTGETVIQFSGIVQKIEHIIGGTIFFDGSAKQFKFCNEKNKEEIPIELIADGWKKIALIALLLKSQALRSQMKLFWDEPEANLNPRLIRLIAECIVVLAEWGIQVFLTTHSLFLMREIKLLLLNNSSFKDGDVRYFNLLGDGEFECGNNFDDLSQLLLLEESLNQANRYLNQKY